MSRRGQEKGADTRACALRASDAAAVVEAHPECGGAQHVDETAEDPPLRCTLQQLRRVRFVRGVSAHCEPHGELRHQEEIRRVGLARRGRREVRRRRLRGALDDGALGGCGSDAQHGEEDRDGVLLLLGAEAARGVDNGVGEEDLLHGRGVERCPRATSVEEALAEGGQRALLETHAVEGLKVPVEELAQVAEALRGGGEARGALSEELGETGEERFPVHSVEEELLGAN